MKRKALNIRIITAALAMFTTVGAFAQDAAATAAPAPVAEAVSVAPQGFFDNTAYIGLTIVAVLLLVIIGVLSSVLKGLGRQHTNIQIKKHEGDPVIPERQTRTTWVRGASVIALVLMACTQTFAAVGDRVNDVLEVPKAPNADWVLIIMVAFILFEFAAIIVLVQSIKKMMVANGLIADAVLLTETAAEAKKVKAGKPTFMNKWLTRAVPIEKEETIMFDHEYDGIRELDNSLPPWWLYGFYISIVFAVIYLFHYHVFGTGELSAAELKTEYAKAEADKNAMMKQMGATGEVVITEESVTVLTDEASINSGKETFTNMCASCHGSNGQGDIGPNLADDYWIYGGSIKNIFKTITNGTPNGMQAWKAQLSPKTIQELGSYIKSIKGTVANGKEPQGELYKEEEVVKSDSTEAKADTVATKSGGVK